MGSWDERFRSESAYLRPFRDERCVNNNTFPLFSQAVLYKLLGQSQVSGQVITVMFYTNYYTII